MYGVSPAYFVSRFSDRFRCGDIAGSLAELKAAGFDAFQPEVFHPEDLDGWRSGGAVRVGAAARQAGLAASQTVGHCLLHAFATPAALASDWGIVEFEKLLDGVQQLAGCDVLTVVIPPFQPRATDQLTAGVRADCRRRLVEKLDRMLDLAERAACRLALEIVPGSLVGGTEGFLRLHAELGRPALAYNFDTGLAWSAREWVPLLPAALGPLIAGTHLKDNFHDGAALAPGQGSIPWAETLAALRAAGYAGSLDIEFHCPPETATAEYGRALDYLQALAADRTDATYRREQC